MTAHDARMTEVQNRGGALRIAQHRLDQLCRDTPHDIRAITTARAAVKDRAKHLHAAEAALRLERTTA